MSSSTTLAVIAALVALAVVSLGAVVFVSGDDAIQRLGLFFGVAGTSVAALVAALRADAAAKALDAGLDGRLQEAIRKTNRERRRSDVPEDGEA